MNRKKECIKIILMLCVLALILYLMGCGFHPQYQWDAGYMVMNLREPNCVGRCKILKEKYPELEMVSGYYMNKPHMWLIDKDGVIVEPSLLIDNPDLYEED